MPNNITVKEQELIDRIDAVRMRKESENIVPTHAMLIHDIGNTEENKVVLRSLCKKGVLKCGRTINDVYFVKI